MPRYNTAKQTLQEIPCEDDYFMPVQFESNRFRDNGAAHCKYKKDGCVSMGMKVFDNGSPTKNRRCYCDYKQNYIPEFPGELTDGIYFEEHDNRCVMSDICVSPNKELNMSK